MTPSLRTHLLRGAAELGVPLDALQIAAFSTYLDLLLRWNARIQLTSVTAPTDVVDRHFLDSLALARHLGDAQTLVDVGSGPGFPGLPLAIVRPSLHVTLVESIHKKAAFLSAVERELSLRNTTIVAERFEALRDRGDTFDAAVSRATLPPPEWIARGRDLTRPGGTLFAFVVPGPDADPDRVAPDWAEHFLTASTHTYAPARTLLAFHGRRSCST